MTDHVARQAGRLRPPSWRDSRLVVGLLLILLSTALGGWALASADHTVPVYAADGPLVVGQPLRADDLRRVDVRLGDGAAAYLSAGAPLPADVHLLRPLADGELIPRSAVGTVRDVSTRVVAVPVDASAASLVTVGSVVDVFVNRPATAGANSAGGGSPASGRTTYAGPELLVAGVSVAAVPDSGSVLGTSATRRAVHLVIPEEKVKTLVADMDQDSRITLVPAPGSVREGGS